jgi:Transcription factor e(y)2
MAGADGATQRVTRSMSEIMQESGKKDRLKELLRTALETAGWRESVRLASDAVIAQAHPTKLSAKEIAAAVRESALGRLLSPTYID